MVTTKNKVYIDAWHANIRQKVNDYESTALSNGAIRIRYGKWDCGPNTIIEFGKYDEDTINKVKQVIGIVTSPTNIFNLESASYGVNHNYLDVTGDKEKILFKLNEWEKEE